MEVLFFKDVFTHGNETLPCPFGCVCVFHVSASHPLPQRVCLACSFLSQVTRSVMQSCKLMIFGSLGQCGVDCIDVTRRCIECRAPRLRVQQVMLFRTQSCACVCACARSVRLHVVERAPCCMC